MDADSQSWIRFLRRDSSTPATLPRRLAFQTSGSQTPLRPYKVTARAKRATESAISSIRATLRNASGVAPKNWRAPRLTPMRRTGRKIAVRHNPRSRRVAV